MAAFKRMDKEDERRRLVLAQLAQTLPAIGSAQETKDVLFAWRSCFELARLSFELDCDRHEGLTMRAPRWMLNYFWQAFNIAFRNSSNAEFHAFAELTKFRNFIDVLRFAAEFDDPRNTSPSPRIIAAILDMAAEHSWEGIPDADDHGSITTCFLYGQRVLNIVTEETSGIMWTLIEQACLDIAWEAVPANWKAVVLERGDLKRMLTSSDLFARGFNAVTWDMEVQERRRQDEKRKARQPSQLSDSVLDETFGNEGLVLDCERIAVATGLVTERW